MEEKKKVTEIKHFDFKRDAAVADVAPSATGDGFDVLDDLGKWPKLQPGLIVQGVLLRRIEVTNKINPDAERFVYQFKLTRPLKATLSIKDDAGNAQPQEVTLKVGEIVNLDERSKLYGLQLLVEDPRVVECWVRVVDKKKLPNGLSAWLIEVKTKFVGRKSPDDILASKTKVISSTKTDEEDKIPF